MNIPVLFIFFVKETAKEAFKSIQKVKPKKLYLASDGPRKNKVGEDILVKNLRKEILNNINWNCEVKILFRNENLGCKNNVSSAISWFFEQEEMGIIIEDDLVLLESAFNFFEEMLIKYKDDYRIGSITSFNPISYLIKYYKYSYFFSPYSIICSWATWRNRWEKYDINMSKYPVWKNENRINSITNNKLSRLYFIKLFDFAYNNDNDKIIWDLQWTFTHFINNWLTIVPIKNQVLHIGYNNKEAVNCNYDAPSYVKKSLPEPLEFPLMHNPEICIDPKIRYLLEKYYYEISFLKIIGYFLKPYIKNERFDIYDKLKKLYYKSFR
jgi:hypothetical protein